MVASREPSKKNLKENKDEAAITQTSELTQIENDILGDNICILDKTIPVNDLLPIISDYVDDKIVYNKAVRFFSNMKSRLPRLSAQLASDLSTTDDELAAAAYACRTVEAFPFFNLMSASKNCVTANHRP
ncbi:MAG: hypothetical protein ABI370_05950 [Gammaproteobacteria bacterium]